MLGLEGVNVPARKLTVAAAALSAAALLAACQSNPAEDSGNGGDVYMGNATAAASPASSRPAGTVHPFDAVRDLDATGDLIAVRSGGELTVGTLEEITSGRGRKHTLDDACGDVTANNGTFVAACGNDIKLITSDGEQTVHSDSPVTAAALTASGEIVAGSHDDKTIRVFRDGKQTGDFDAARETDRILTAPRGGNRDDAVVRLNNFDTTIQDLDWKDGRQGGTLRAGLGVGGVAAGPHGLILAADATGGQLLVYNTDDIIRLQMSAPVGQSPWAVAWDNPKMLAWASSTATNTAEGYSLSTGVPVLKENFATVANAQSMVSLPDGTLLLASASGEGLQVVTPGDTTTS